MEGKQPQRDIGEPLMLTHKEAAKKLNISLTKFYELLQQGKLHNLELGPQIRRVALSECEAYVRSLIAEADLREGAA